MKSTIKLIVIIFIFFLSAPTIVSLIEKKLDIGMFFNFSEEELLHKDLKLIKADPNSCSNEVSNFYSDSYLLYIAIFSKMEVPFIKPLVFIFSPPPNI